LTPCPNWLWAPPRLLIMGALSLELKWPGYEADHSRPSSAEVRQCVEL